MPWPSDKIPSLRPHSSGRAIATFNGNDCYFGKFGTPEAQAAYDAYVAEWLASGRRSHPADSRRSKKPTINELIVKYLDFAEGYYVKDGKPTKEVWAVKAFLKPLRELYGRTVAADFGPLQLKAVRERFLGADLSRNEVNNEVLPNIGPR